MFRIKPLLRKMSYSVFIKEAIREEWIIPFEEELLGKDFEYKFVWVQNVVPEQYYTFEDKKYNVKLNYAFNIETQKLQIVNGNFILDCVILKKEK